MSTKHFFVLLSLFVLTVGCKMQDRQESPNVATAPPYWQSHSQQAQNQLADMRAFHERESAKIAEEMHIFRNREMERLTAAGEELQREQNKKKIEEKEERIVSQPEIIAEIPEPRTAESREKWSWTNPSSWFKKKERNGTPLVSEADRTMR